MIVWFDISDYINIGSVISFIVGIFFGLTIFILIYLYAILKSLHKGKYLVNVQSYDIDAKEIELLVEGYRNRFKEEKLKGIGPNVFEVKEISKEMTKEIAEKFFPDSDYPMYEITLDEAIMLATYVTKRVDELLNYRGIRMFRAVKLSQIIKWSSVKKTIDETPIVQTSKKYRITKKLKAVWSAINIINPVYWFKRVVVNKSTDIVVRKICMVVIGIIGEETYKVYSKSLFNEELQIHVNAEDLFNELRDELDNEGTEEVEVDNDVQEKEKTRS